MTRKEFEALVEVIKAIIDEKTDKGASSDEGLNSLIRARALQDDFIEDHCGETSDHG